MQMYIKSGASTKSGTLLKGAGTLGPSVGNINFIEAVRAAP